MNNQVQPLVGKIVPRRVVKGIIGVTKLTEKRRLSEEDILPNTSTSAERILKTLNPAGNANTTMC